MSYYEAIHGGGHPSRSARRARDPLQVPIALTFDEDRPFSRIQEAVRGVMLWLAIVLGAAIGVLFAGAAVPDLKAAAPHQTGQGTAIVGPAPSATRGVTS